jgi:hypothetical protein
MSTVRDPVLITIGTFVVTLWSGEATAKPLELATDLDFEYVSDPQIGESGQTPSGFCRQNDLPESTVSLWRGQLRGLRTNAADDGAFLEVPGVAMPAAAVGGIASSAALVVRLPGDIQLELAAGYRRRLARGTPPGSTGFIALMLFGVSSDTPLGAKTSPPVPRSSPATHVPPRRDSLDAA